MQRGGERGRRDGRELPVVDEDVGEGAVNGEGDGGGVGACVEGDAVERFGDARLLLRTWGVGVGIGGRGVGVGCDERGNRAGMGWCGLEMQLSDKAG